MNIYTFTKKAGQEVAGRKNTGAGDTLGLTDEEVVEYADAIKAGEIVPYGDYRPGEDEPVAEEAPAKEAKAAEDKARKEAAAAAKKAKAEGGNA